MKISSSGKTCPKCGNDALHRKFRSSWMRLIRAVKHYKCGACGRDIIVLFGYLIDRRLALYSLLGIVSIVCTIILFWIIILIAKDSDLSEYYKRIKEGDDLVLGRDGDELKKHWLFKDP